MAALTKTKQRLFWAGLAAIPILFFLVLEGGLRVAGYGDDLRLFTEVDWKGTTYYQVNPRVVRRYFSDPDFGTYVSRDRFLARKPEGTYRIFCLGASTTIGYPYMYNGAYSALLKDRLEAFFPEKRIEVVNVGITAINSFAVADLAREVTAYEPDLLVVYAGHNEFYGALGVGSTEYVGSSPWLVRTYLALQRLKTVQLVRDGLVRTVATFAGTDEPGGVLMEKMVREQHIRHGSPAYEAAKRYFRANYEAVIETAQAHGVDVLVSTLTSNLRDQPPFVSLHAEGLPADREAAWKARFDRARAVQEAGRCDEAVPLFREALAVDDQRAEGHFYLARCLEAQGAYDEARAAYVRARDLDGLPFRAGSAFNDIVRDLARVHRVPLVEMDTLFARHSPQGIPGESLFWEHVHPRLDGYFLMAKAFVEAMRAHGLVAPEGAWLAERERPDAYFRARAGLTEFDLEVARMRIDMLKSRWPFRAQPVPFAYHPRNPMQQAAWEYSRGEIGWVAAHDRLGDLYLEQGDLDRAAAEYLAIARITPYDPTYLMQAADVLARARHFDAAAESYARALRIEEIAEAHAKLGIVVYQLQRFPDAIRHLDAALELAAARPSALPDGLRVQLHVLLGTAYLNVRDVAAATEQLDHLRSLAPSAPQTVALQAALERFRP